MANVYGLIFEVEDKTGSGTRSINGNLRKIESQAAKVRSALKGIGDVAGRAVGALGKTAAAATAAAVAFGYLAKNQLDMLDGLGKTAAKLGVSTKFLSEYSFVANQAGVGTDQFQTALQRFIRRLGQAQQGTGELLKPLQQLGINIKDSSGNFRDQTEVFDEFISKLGGVKNEAQRAALAMGAFDTEGVDLVNVAAMGAREIENLRQQVRIAGASFDEDLVKGAEKANDAINALLLRFKGFSGNFFGAMGPAIEQLAKDITAALDEAVAGAGGMEAFARGLTADFLENAGQFIKGLGTAIDGFINGIAQGINIMKQLIVSISNIPGAGFNATFGSAEDIKSLETQKSAVASSLAEQKRLMQENQAEITRLGNAYKELEGGIFGKRDPDNIAGQIASATMAGQHFHTQVQRLEGELENLNNTMVFDRLATDVSYVGDTLSGVGDTLQDQAAKIREGIAAAGGETAAVIAETNPHITRLIESYEKLAATANALNENIVEPNKQLMATFDEQRHKLDVLVERYLDLDSQASSTGNNANLAMRALAKEVLATAQGLNGLSDAMKDAIGDVIVDELVGNAKEQYNSLKLEIEAVEEQLAFYKSMVGNTLADQDTLNLLIETFSNRLSAAKGELRGLTGELISLGDLEVAVGQKTQASADAMARYNEFKASGTRTTAELSAAASILGITITRTNKAADDGIVSFAEYSEALEKSAINTVNEEKYLRRLKEALDAASVSTAGLTETQREQLSVVNERLKQIEEDQAPKSFKVVENLNNAMEGMIGTVSSTFADVILGLKDGFSSLEDLALNVLRTIISTLIEAFIRSQILGQSLNMGGGGLFGGLLGGIMSLGTGGLFGLGALALGGIALGGGFRANGGPVRTGESYMVGERGPEIFTPNTSGNIISNEEMNAMGGQGDLAVNFTINAIDTQTGIQFLLENKRVITGVIQEAYMRRGTSGPLG